MKDERRPVADALRAAGFEFDPADRVWHRPGARGLGYTEGEAAERDLLARVSACIDRSVDSREIAAQVVDWPTEYHLSRIRANLLKPFAIGSGDRVVELGAGCGALTRALGERGAEVIAIEGRRERACIAAKRCEDLPNVVVVAADLADAPALSADWVTLIGVLEYAPVYGSPPDPVGTTLRCAASQLARGGRLVVAIENALGLKYWAGCAEDHLGERYYGIEGRYAEREPTTFSRRRLLARVAAAGLPAHRLVLAFPDYKLPTALIDERALVVPDFDAGSFAAMAVGRDYGGAGTRAFTEPLALMQLADAGLLAEMANSFVLVAAREARDADRALAGRSLAWSFSADRCPGLASATAIVAAPDGALRVVKRLDPQAAPPVSSQWRQQLELDSRYVAGRRFDLELMRAASRSDPSVFEALLDRWIALLLEARIDAGGSAVLLEPDSIDRIPRNLILASDGRLVTFDQEWIARQPVPIAWVVLRGLLMSLPPIVNGRAIRERSLVEVARTALGRHGVPIDSAAVSAAVDLESQFIAWVRGGEPSRHRWPESLLHGPLGGNVPSAFDADGVALARALLDVERVRAALESERDQHARLIEAYRMLEASAHAMQARIEDAERFARETLGAGEALGREFARERADHARLIDAYRDAEAGLSDLRGRAAELESLVARERVQHAELTAALEAERADHARLIEAHRDLEAGADLLRSALADAQAHARGSIERIAVLERDMAELQRVHAVMTGSVARLEAAVLEGEETRKGLEVRVADLAAALQDSDRALRETEAERQAAAVRHEAERQEAAARHEAERVALAAGIADRQGVIDRLGRALADERRVLADRESELVRSREYQSVIGAELERLQREQASLGVRIGKGLMNLGARFAPAGTRRAAGASLMAAFVAILLEQGPSAALSRTLAFVGARLRGRAHVVPARPRADPTGAEGTAVRTDHPQLAAYISREEPGPESIVRQHAEVERWTVRPRVSLIVPVYRLPRDVLEATLASVEAQTYPEWETCVVWADVEDDAGWAWLQQRVANEPRHVVRRLAVNGGISRNSDAALELATGEFVGLLDHDDTLAPWALYAMVERLQADPALDFLYSDKDSISADGGVRMNALFKPAWSPEMLHSVNYLTHFNLIRTSLLREIGGWRPETDGAQDWDLFFRVTESTSRIARVPGILYHWRVLPTSTATGLAAKPYAAAAQLRSQREHFQRRGLPAIVEPSPEGMFRVRWPGRRPHAIGVWQAGSTRQLIHTLDLLRFVQLQGDERIEVVHAGELMPELAVFEQVWPGRVRFHASDQPGWPAALTHALEQRADSVLLLDGCADGLDPEIVAELTGWTDMHPDIVFAAPLVLDAGDTLQEAGRVVSADGRSAPLFAGAPLYAYGWIGGPLWYRNVRACSPYAVSLKADAARARLGDPSRRRGDRDGFVAFCVELSGSGRGLVDPFARIRRFERPETAWPNDGALYRDDPYFNPAFAAVSPLALSTEASP